MTAKTLGWVALGISATGTPPPHENGDMWVGWIEPNGTVVLLDTVALYAGPPIFDTVQNLKLVSGSQLNGWTTITFKRPRDTGDAEQDVVITNSTMPMLWAWCQTAGRSPTDYDFHHVAGYAEVDFNAVSAFYGGLWFDPAELLLLMVGGVFVLYLIWRVIWRCFHAQTAMWRTSSSQGTTFIELDPQDANESTALLDRQTQRDVLPPLDPAFAAASTDLEDPEGPEDPITSPLPTEALFLPPSVVEKESIFSAPAGIIGAESTGGDVSNYVRGLAMQRIPKTQISTASIVIAVVFVCMNIFSFFFGYGPNLGAKAGDLIAANSFLVVVMATRNSLLVFLLGIPFDRVIMYHRWLGYFTVLVNILHFALQLLLGKQSQEDLMDYVFVYEPTGFAGFVFVFAVFLTSLEWIRRNHFEWFFYLHFLFIPYFIMGALHNYKFIPYMAAAMSLYVLDRLIRFFWGLWPVKAAVRVKGHREYKNNHEHRIIQITFGKSTLARLTKTYHPAQYVFVNFPQISLFEWHPFSLSSGPDDKEMEIHVRSLGNHTRKILELAEASSQLWLRVDGPYGNLRLNLRRFPNLLLVSGGIGFSPVVGIVKDVYRIGTLVSNKVLRPSHVMETVRVLWVARSALQVAWFEDEFAAFVQAASEPGMPALEVVVYVTGAKPDDEAFLALTRYQKENARVDFFTGRPHFDEYCSTAIVPKGKANLAFVCGPSQMVNSLWDACAAQSKRGAAITFRHEVFEF